MIGVDNKAQWHNEVKGVLMINNKHRGEADNEEEENKEEITAEEAEAENQDYFNVNELSEREVEAEYRRYQELIRRKNLSKKELEQESKKKMAFEIEFDYFFNHFWKGVILASQFTLTLSPMVAWSEIMSSIKGSA
mmetsp:Transcript_28177/g.24963  ORF Transcript_28177/g.24963 Transcript_28177/m.24963 type:complete len:136 (+) Transcript_28177:1782-2189(+)